MVISTVGGALASKAGGYRESSHLAQGRDAVIAPTPVLWSPVPLAPPCGHFPARQEVLPRLRHFSWGQDLVVRYQIPELQPAIRENLVAILVTGYNVMEVAEAAFLYSKLFEEEAMLVLHKCAKYFKNVSSL